MKISRFNNRIKVNLSQPPNSKFFSVLFVYTWKEETKKKRLVSLLNMNTKVYNTTIDDALKYQVFSWETLKIDDGENISIFFSYIVVLCWCGTKYMTKSLSLYFFVIKNKRKIENIVPFFIVVVVVNQTKIWNKFSSYFLLLTKTKREQKKIFFFFIKKINK